MLPHATTRQLRQRGARTIGRFVRPIFDKIQRMLFLFVVANARLLLTCNTQSPQRDVISSTLAQHGGELIRNHSVEQRHIFLEDLFLQRDRVRADDDAFALLKNSSNCRNEVGKTLADSCASLNEQTAFRFNVRFNRFSHAHLFSARFVSVNPPSKWTFRAKKISREQRHEMERVPRRCACLARCH